MLYLSFFVVLGCSAGCILLGWIYFQRYQLSRPGLGVMSLGDVATMIAAIIVVPYLYLILPPWLVTGIFAVGLLSILYALGEPLLPVRWAIWAIALILIGADIAGDRVLGTDSAIYLSINNIVLILSVVGITNLWAQSGMKARDVTGLAMFLAVYDLIATSLLPLTSDVFHHLAGIPLTPLVAWSAGNQRLSIGMGDLLLATVFPLVMRKAFGTAAGIAAMAIELAVLAVMMLALSLAAVHVALPVMTALGPLMALQYAFWIRRLGVERTTQQFRRLEPQPG